MQITPKIIQAMLLFPIISGSLLNNDLLPKWIKKEVKKAKTRDIPMIDQDCKTMGRPYAAYQVNKTLIHRCMYFECYNREYTLKSCPDGLGVSRRIVKKGYSNSYPCTRTVRKCRHTLLEKGVENIRVSGCGPDIIWVIDVSCSITEVNKMKVKNFVSAVTRRIPAFPPFAQFGALTFASSVYDTLFMNTYNNQKNVMNALRHMKTKIPKKECGTATWLALQSARESQLSEKNGNRPDRADIVVVMTDGRTNPPEEWMKTVEQARLLHKVTDKVILIELPNASLHQGSLKQQQERKRLAEREFSEIPTDKTKDRYSLSTFDDLETLIEDLVNLSCFQL
ncbi:unnamed protein product [Owenia fusiformis]|uniref:VWFA domain-containing protein n=1 Tax=Owenia fusiformis TaxID=6347 RepID=A0A8S4N3L3_OWEFU|nr:unnamed protein product [Owenia fusiformis]